MKTIIIGLGNPILGDDGIGWKVSEEIKKSDIFKSTSIEVDCLAVGGLTLMERMVGFQRAILVDALQTGKYPPGTVVKLRLEDVPEKRAGHIASAHDVNLKVAIQLGREMGAQLPEEIYIVGIEAQRVYDISEEISPLIRSAIPYAIQYICELLQTVDL
jgi:hydrogenase maturation protease